uniref:WD_REPEATS_REGION domain-containing protein n=1 Tax=Strongyloides papillosus TaxID=174720 RepID=A0A0N5CC36_STREA
MEDTDVSRRLKEDVIDDINNNHRKMVPFSECRYENFAVRKHFDADSKRIKSMDISPCGDFLATSTGSEKIILFDVPSGCEVGRIPTKKYGCSHVVFAGDGLKALHSSEKINDDIRYLCLEKKKYIRYFSGHKDDVLSLSMSPDGQTFLSSSRDGAVKMWDFRSDETCMTSTYFHLNPRVAYDPKGTIYAVSDEKNLIKFYDSRYINRRPFKVMSSRSSTWNVNNIRFSLDGRSILASADGNYFYTFDTFTGEKMSFGGISNCRRLNFGVDFSPCGRYIIAGSDFGELLYYDAVKGRLLKTFKSPHSGHVENVLFHRKYLMLVTGVDDLIFWTPDYDGDEVFDWVDL